MYITGCEYPFNTEEFRTYIDDVRNSIKKEINSYQSEKLLNTSTNDFVEYLYSKYVIDSIPILDNEPIMVQSREAKIKNPYYRGSPFDYEYLNGTALDFEVGFIGNQKYFHFQPSSYSLGYPRVTISDGKICFSLNLLRDEFEKKDAIKSEVTRTIDAIRKALETLKSDANTFNQSIKTISTNLVETRKSELLARANLVANLGFQIKPKTVPQTYAVSVEKKKIVLTPPVASTEPYEPEPCLPESTYEDILRTLDLMSETMEKSPLAFVSMDEESIRSHFLVDLNAMFEGTASGETFNKKGKTDILISVEGKNIFIGECKFWKGEKYFLDTIDQILGYLTWRDTKACILVFNRKKGLTEVIEKIKEAVPKHGNFKRYICAKSETDFRYVFANNEDRNREIFLAIKVYDIPTE